MLRVSPAGNGTFRAGPRRSASERSFRGAVVAQALLAAGATVTPDRPAHSLHAYFLRAGEASAPTGFRVDRVRDGGSYSTRRVTAEQDGRAILELTASFQVGETGFTHQVPQLAAPDPESLSTHEEAAADTQGAVREWFAGLARRHPFDIRFDGELPRVAAGRGETAPPTSQRPASTTPSGCTARRAPTSDSASSRRARERPAAGASATGASSTAPAGWS